ncbi:peptidase T [Natronoflexus pectinivorans]|uniref:Peptidase T n=1 Tax=Natronoflexus pectinivorans TaxID=682526 RepID=A0A4R2GIB3_9BACT|nr:peptidase T [Natronoflexus pectinivorans]TCO07633.1 tripeptide aminopeptidase [Natronoflexus pectinivorans]
MNVVDRFLEYVSIDTRSNDQLEECPSTSGQMFLARLLSDELKRIGMQEVELDDNGYVMATLPSNFDGKVPVIGFIAHMDTSPDMSGENVKPRITKNYDGGDIILDKKNNIILKPDDFPELINYIGQDIITTSGNTLLGADDKAGIAEIVTAMEFLIQNPSVKHGEIRVCFTPDEEIGRGANKFDVRKFGANFAYTIDGGEIGELEYENFNAAVALIEIQGRNVHPGYAFKKMVNSLEIAGRIVSTLPVSESPAHTKDYDGFYHVISVNGEVEKTEIEILIRDFDEEGFNSRKKYLENLVSKINEEISIKPVKIKIEDQYQNMRKQIESVLHVVELAKKAMLESGVKPIIRPIRGGTDGARLSYMGLPTPNIFAGGHNFHGRYEFIPVQSMEKAVDVIVKISELAIN